MKKHYRHENDCLNCGTTLEGKFCHNCGQENLQIKESFGHMMNHAISDYFHFDHQFFHTLKPLFFKPGYLTTEYMAGRRAQYLHPVKMYIFISVVYFVTLFQSGHEAVKIKISDPVKAGKVIDSIAKDPDISAEEKENLTQAAGKLKHLDVKEKKPGRFRTFTGDTSYDQYTVSQNKLPENKRDGFLKRTYNQKALIYNEKYGERAKEVFSDELKHNTPKMMFILLPLFALILGVTFMKSKKYYVEHLIYSFHLHCFMFLFMAIIMLSENLMPNSWLPAVQWINLLATLYVMWYIYRSLRVVYHRSKFRTITKIIGMSFMYFFAFLVSGTLIFLITALTMA